VTRVGLGLVNTTQEFVIGLSACRFREKRDRPNVLTRFVNKLLVLWRHWRTGPNVKALSSLWNAQVIFHR